ncbi:MAG: serine hydrolase [Acidobacteria bacterium]|nr:serine hydrolase [Acidobacteriota bacterium]
MKKTSLSIICLLCFVFLSFPGSDFAQDKKETDFSEAFHVIDIWLEAQRDYDHLPGITAALIEDQTVPWAGSFGMADLKNHVGTTPDTIFSICSISKLFTAVAIMQLRDAGKLRLDDRIEDVLPWYNLQQQWEDTGPTTIRSLLTHSSGLPREADYPYWTGPDFPFPDSDQIKNKLGSQKTLYPASRYFQYSNLGLTLLGEIVAHVADVPFDRYIQENILQPLRMSSTRTKMPESLWRDQLSTGYSALKRDGTRDMLKLFQAEGIAPAAGFSSTVLDLARFASWQFRLLEKGGEEILKASTLREMQRVHWVDPDWETTWGLGFSVSKVDGKSMVGHGGSCPGYRSILRMDPSKKQAFVVMINAQGVNPGQYAEGMRALMKKYEDEKAEDAKEGLNLEDYAGYYDEQPWWGESAVFPWKGYLAVLSLPSENPANSLTLLKHIEKDTFRRVRKDKTLGEEIVFERDDSGRVVRMWQHSNYNNRIK